MDSVRSIREQAAAIPFRLRKGRVEIALITSSRRGRWTVPKGDIERGESAGESALREALEEAGLGGVLLRGRAGRFRYRKAREACEVEVFLLRVTKQRSRWSEDHLRVRRWMSPADALRRLDRKPLRRLLAGARGRFLEESREWVRA